MLKKQQKRILKSAQTDQKQAVCKPKKRKRMKGAFENSKATSQKPNE